MSSKHLSLEGRVSLYIMKTGFPYSILLVWRKRDSIKILKISVSEGLGEKRGERCWRFINTGWTSPPCPSHSLELTALLDSVTYQWQSIRPLQVNKSRNQYNYLTNILITLSFKKRNKISTSVKSSLVLFTWFQDVFKAQLFICGQTPFIPYCINFEGATEYKGQFSWCIFLSNYSSMLISCKIFSFLSRDVDNTLSVYSSHFCQAVLFHHRYRVIYEFIPLTFHT